MNFEQTYPNGFELKQKSGFQLPEPVVFNYSNLWRHEKPLLDVIKDTYGNRQLDTLGGSYGWSVRYQQAAEYQKINLHTLGAYLEAFSEGDITLPYLRHLSIHRAMPALKAHIHDPQQFSPNWVTHRLLDKLGGPELFIGQQGTSFGQLHQDQVSVHVGFVQLQGEKAFTLFPPKDTAYLQSTPGKEFPYQRRNSKLKYADLNDMEQHPELRRTHPVKLVLKPGQALLMPADWWHTTLNLTDSVSYSIRIVNRSNALKVISRYAEGIPRLLGIGR